MGVGTGFILEPARIFVGLDVGESPCEGILFWRVANGLGFTMEQIRSHCFDEERGPGCLKRIIFLGGSQGRLRLSAGLTRLPPRISIPLAAVEWAHAQ